ncbi:MAG: 3-deoxy-7-phosphoheptulonate synthase [Candidatus Hydrogenedentes bacterium]|nr:3-deoxy-7-phosphoheptulonate synthase [Candidatus Hydrogenedentota bacterium]
MQRTHDINVRAIVPLIAPLELKERLPMSAKANTTVVEGRKTVIDILNGTDRRLMAVVGPCSIHDEKAALEFAQRLRGLAEELEEQIFVVMRVYFEKPRTIVGWKGLINDPHLDGSFDIAAGLHLGRKLLLDINELGLPAGTEMLDPISPQYMADLVTWASIGARTTESQTHRQMASGLSMPVGYKNGTDGNLTIAVQAMQAGLQAHSFLGIDGAGRTCVVNTNGNPWGHLILRGGAEGPNYDAKSVAWAIDTLRKAEVSTSMVVDCSHANSAKDYRKQPDVWRNVISQRVEGNDHLVGMMLEANLVEGKQELADPAGLIYGVSVTDGCVGWETTESLLRLAAQQLAAGEHVSDAVK